jgi:hydroxypyruvate isomerase
VDECRTIVAAMPQFAANLTMLFTEVPFLDRFERAAAAGFGAVEFLFPYAHVPREIKARLDGNGLVAVLINVPPGDTAAGERGVACIPGREAEFRAGVAQALEFAVELGVANVHVMAGRTPEGETAQRVRRTYVDNLRYAAERFAPAGVRALIEPLNAFDMPGYYLNATAQAVAVIDEVAATNLLLQYDLYHAQRSEGELAATLERHLAKIGHLQIADNPGRHEPGSGEINYAFLFGHIDRIGYRGYVGCEYRPLGTTEAGLGWFAQRRQGAPREPGG